MFNFIIGQIISLALKFGVAYVLQKFPWLPKNISVIIDELIEKLKDPTHSDSIAKKQAAAKIKACYGIGCPIDTKGLE